MIMMIVIKTFVPPAVTTRTSPPQGERVGPYLKISNVDNGGYFVNQMTAHN
jgi:hypothetical protein